MTARRDSFSRAIVRLNEALMASEQTLAGMPPFSALSFASNWHGK